MTGAIEFVGPICESTCKFGVYKKYQKYLIGTYFYNFILISLVFLALSFILNFFK